MSQAGLLLRAYYEAVYELLEAEKDSLAARIDELLTEEVERRGFEGFDGEKYSAYRDACTAFVDERIETFSPIGYQYTFDRARTQDAFELELQLNWYDGRQEFEALVEAACDKAKGGLADANLRALAEELIRQVGVFPDKSIISAYEAGPALTKLPDYIVAVAIEEIVESQKSMQ